MKITVKELKELKRIMQTILKEEYTGTMNNKTTVKELIDILKMLPDNATVDFLVERPYERLGARLLFHEVHGSTVVFHLETESEEDDG